MFSSFAQGTSGAGFGGSGFGLGPASAPVANTNANANNNPFAAASTGSGSTTPSPFGGFGAGAGAGAGSANTTKPNPFNPFAASDGADKQGEKHATASPWGATQQQSGTLHNGFAQGKSSPWTGTSPSAPPSVPASNDPFAKKIYECLHRQGISPPAWPSQPGNPTNKQVMTKFREAHEEYRGKVRAALTKAGLIDDPNKRKALRDAIEFKGICEEMCPEFEKITRITELDVVFAEKDQSTGYADTTRMVKKLARSAAGQEAPLPMDVRSIPSLRRSLDYLVNDVLKNDGNLPVVHGFLWDRTRAIRRDFSFFSSLSAEELQTQVYVLENIARFHVTSLHLLSQEGKAPEDFVEQQELEQLGKALLSLRDVYDDCNQQGINCENEPEFRAYYLLFHGRDPSILEMLQRQWKPHLWRDSDHVRTAVSLVEALQNTQDFHGPLKGGPSLAASGPSLAYFRIVKDPKVSYTMACFAECHFPHLRRSILQTVKRSLARPKDPAKDVSAMTLNRFLQFDTVDQAITFAELHDLQFVPDPQNPNNKESQILVLESRGRLPHRRMQHQFSQTMVENKRGSAALPTLIHQSVYSDPNASVQSQTTEGSLFVQDNESIQHKTPTPGFMGSSTTLNREAPVQQPSLAPGSAQPGMKIQVPNWLVLISILQHRASLHFLKAGSSQDLAYSRCQNLRVATQRRTLSPPKLQQGSMHPEVALVALVTLHP